MLDCPSLSASGNFNLCARETVCFYVIASFCCKKHRFNRSRKLRKIYFWLNNRQSVIEWAEGYLSTVGMICCWMLPHNNLYKWITSDLKNVIQLIPETNKFHTAIIGYARNSNLRGVTEQNPSTVLQTFFFQLKPFIFRMIYDAFDNIRFREMKHA